MSLATAGVNAALDQIGSVGAGTRITHLALHTAFPNDAGSNECSGGSPAYARQAVTWAAAASRSMAMSGTETFDTNQEVQWLSGWTASSGGTMLARWPLGGSAKEYSVDTSTDVVTAKAHGYVDGDKIVFYNGSVPGGLTEGTIYFVRDKTTDTFKVAATSGGSAIDLTSEPTGQGLVSKIIPNTGGQRTITISTLSLHGQF